MRGIVQRVFVLVAVAVAAAACGGDNESSPPARDGTTVSATTPTTAGTPTGPLSIDAPVPPARAVGKIVINTATLSGIPVAGVAVHISLQQPCDPAKRDIPVGETTAAWRQDTVTDASGTAAFTVPTGCYSVGMTPPAGTVPVPEGMHSVFLTTAGQTVTGTLRFQDSGPCSAEAIAADLDLSDQLLAATPTSTSCDGHWAVIAWDVPGDSQRLVRYVGTKWTTYVVFPHNVCWSNAAADGVPADLRHYFTNC